MEGVSFTCSEGRDSAEAIEASNPRCVVLALEGDSTPSHACHKRTGGGISSPQSSCAQIGHLYVSSFSQLPCSSMERDARSEMQMWGDT